VAQNCYRHTMNCFDNNFVPGESCVTSAPCILMSHIATVRYWNVLTSCWQPKIYLIRVIFNVRIFTSDNSSVKTGTSGPGGSAWKQRRFGCKVVWIFTAMLFILLSVLGKSPYFSMQYTSHIPDTPQCSFGNFEICFRHYYCWARKRLAYLTTILREVD
jgi:hypothetical protein